MDMAIFFFVVVATILTPSRSMAELKAIEDNELSQIVGQAYISIDENTYASADNNVKYMRINLGMDIETQLNADRLEFGKYARDDPRGEARDADIIFEDFSLGTIYDSSYYENNKRVAMPLKSDGTRYSDGEIVPFKISDPFIEFALDETTGEPIGVRVGFGEAEGIMSATIKSITGNLNIDILDRGKGLKDASSNGNVFDQIVTLLAPYLTSGAPLESKAILLDANGNPDPIRATMAGIPNGEKLSINNVAGSVGLLIGALSPTLSSDIDVDFHGPWYRPLKYADIEITVQDCAAIGINTCFNLEQFQTLAIGKVTEGDGRSYLTGSETGAFVSFQSQNLKWLKDVKNTNPNASQFIEATQGSYLNIPNGLTLNLKESLDGIPRARTEYIDRGVGLF